jgi:hypothetical protein
MSLWHVAQKKHGHNFTLILPSLLQKRKSDDVSTEKSFCMNTPYKFTSGKRQKQNFVKQAFRALGSEIT